jgi:tRNA(Ile)-lysidine synthase
VAELNANAATRAALRRDKAVAEIIRSWRALTGGATVRDSDRRTLIACSGGMDSSALALALGAASRGLALGHIVHDLRPQEQALADRDAVRALAERLGMPFLEASVSVRCEKGNLEAIARRLRYKELGGMAGSNAYSFIATAHQGDDQLETILMRLMRGAGPRGLSGIKASRLLSGSAARVIRPMLGVTREDCERICRIAGHQWREDATNQDTDRLRAAVRARLVPEMRRLSPHVARRARSSAELLADAADLVSGHAGALLAKAQVAQDGYSWPRESLRTEPALVLGTMLRLAAANLTAGAGQDRLAWRLVRPVVDAILDRSTEPRRFGWRGLEVCVTAHSVEMGLRS